MNASDSRLQEWIKEGNNYGVATGFGLTIIDSDDQTVRKIVEDKFPQSTIVETPGHRGLHYYFLSNLTSKMFLRTTKGEHAGEILSEGSMAIGPNSIHPNGQSYKIISDAPLAKLTKNELRKLLGDHLVPEKQIHRIENNAAKEKHKGHDLDITKVIPLSGLKVQGAEYYGPHPIHGSETGQNFWVNPAKNCWHCFRHRSGGGPFLWLAVQEGIINCEDAGSNVLRGFKFKQVLRIAVQSGLIDEKTDTDSRETESQGDKLVRLFLDKNPILFHDERRVPCVRFQNSPKQTQRLKTTEVRTKLAGLLWEIENKVPGSEALASALNVLHHLALEGPMQLLHNRVAWQDESIWLDLTDQNWNAIRITKCGWTIESEPPILFRRYPSQLPLTEPAQTGDPWKLLDYVNIREKDRLLFMVYIVALLIPDIPHPILILHGPQGSTKTTLMTFCKDLIDPSAIGVGTLPRDERELIQVLDHSYLNYFDNVSSLNDWTSDALCRATTGMGFSKRQLYTDDEDVIYRLQRPIGINGINVAAQKPDLLDRSLLIGLEQVPENKRRQLKEVQAEFIQDLPVILGGILDSIVKAMNIPEHKLDRASRMADFLSWGYRIAEALGRSGNEFSNSYEENIREAADEAVRADILAEILLEFLEANQEGWDGTATALLSELRSKAEELHISTRQKDWPKNPSTLTRRLRLLKDSLGKIDLDVEFTRGQKRLISITPPAGRLPKMSSESSTPASQNQAIDDIDDVDDTFALNPAFRILRKIKGRFSPDYAVEQVMKTGIARGEADACLKCLIDDNLLSKDPEGYLRLK